jgi:hypothetical protein
MTWQLAEPAEIGRDQTFPTTCIRGQTDDEFNRDLSRHRLARWQCDMTERLTVASSFDRMEEAEGNLADELGLDALLRVGVWLGR